MGQHAYDRLGARRGNHIRDDRRAIRRTRRRFECVKFLRLRQPRKTFQRRVGERISIRVDTRRKIEPGLRRLRIGPPRGKEIAAMPGKG